MLNVLYQAKSVVHLGILHSMPFSYDVKCTKMLQEI